MTPGIADVLVCVLEARCPPIKTQTSHNRFSDCAWDVCYPGDVDEDVCDPGRGAPRSQVLVRPVVRHYGPRPNVRISRNRLPMVTINPGAGGTDFRIGAVLGLSFQVLHQALGAFIVLSLLPIVPVLIIGFGIVVAPQNGAPVALIGIILFMIFAMISQAALVYGALEQLRGHRFTVGEAFSKGFRRFWPVLGVAVVSGVIIIAGLVALLVPGLIALCMLYVAIPACVVEEWGVVQSLTRSAELTKGYRWPILGLIVVVMIGAAIVSTILETLVQAVAGAVVASLLDTALQIYCTALASIIVAIIYYRLRVIKEGVDIERIARHFD